MSSTRLSGILPVVGVLSRESRIVTQNDYPRRGGIAHERFGKHNHDTGFDILCGTPGDSDAQWLENVVGLGAAITWVTRTAFSANVAAS